MYHINPETGRVNICRADPNNPRGRGCDFAVDGVEPPHFTDKAEAHARKEEILADRYGNFAQLTKQPTSNNQTIEISEELKANIEQTGKSLNQQYLDFTENKNIDAFVQYYSAESVMEFGKQLDDLLTENLPWNHSEKDLTKEEYETIETTTRQLFSQLVNNGNNLENELHGNLSNDLQRSVSVLPNSVKEALKGERIATRQVRSDARDRAGQFIKKDNITLQVPGKVTVSSYELETYPDIPAGELMTTGFTLPEEIEEESYGVRIAVKPEQGTEANAMWIGKLPTRSRGFKKVAESAEVWVNGEKTVIDKPLYSVTDRLQTTAHVIEAQHSKNAPKGANESILLHEYIHYTQELDDGMAESKLYTELAEDEKFDEGLNLKVREGFPDSYMGYGSTREVLTRSTEALFYPTVNKYLWGKDRGQNADKVRQWVLGYWVMKDAELRNKP